MNRPNRLNRTLFTFVAALTLAALPFAATAQPAPTLAPVVEAGEGWLNGRLTAEKTKGKVVLVDVFTFGCYNCKNVVPNLRKLSARETSDVIVVGVHSPETAYEKDRANVVDNLRTQGITWPVAIDNSFAIWKAYGVQAWPTQLIFDRKGHLRKTVVGDSQDDAVDSAIKELVAER